jgi:hypothetical protein
LDSSEETFNRRPASERLLQGVHGSSCSDIAASVTAHTIGYPVKRPVLDGEVLVDGAHSSDIRSGP